MFALIPRHGSGYALHEAQPHGVSSIKLGCGRTMLRNGIRVTEGLPSPLPPGTHTCPACTTPNAKEA